MGGLASLAKKDWMNTRLRLTLTNHVVCVFKKKKNLRKNLGLRKFLKKKSWTLKIFEKKQKKNFASPRQQLYFQNPLTLPYPLV